MKTVIKRFQFKEPEEMLMQPPAPPAQAMGPGGPGGPGAMNPMEMIQQEAMAAGGPPAVAAVEGAAQTVGPEQMIANALGV